MKNLLRALFVTLALLAVVAPSSAAAQVKIPAGNYELVPDANYAAGFDVSGIVVEFTESTMTAIQAGTVLVKSTTKMNGDVITLTDVEGQLTCPSPATYKVAISAKGVRFTPVEDPCAERSAVLAQVTLVKRG
ncbi:MAG: hypothetical protein IT361_06840 [Gemmatimonadaceae bacterium]|nr:hypothetical protein [Gemmatimonadaceae bacterium]